MKRSIILLTIQIKKDGKGMKIHNSQFTIIYIHKAQFIVVISINGTYVTTRQEISNFAYVTYVNIVITPLIICYIYYIINS